MNQQFPFYFEIKPIASFADQQKEVIETQEKLLHSLSSLNANLIISIRYYFQPLPDSKITTYLIINQFNNQQPQQTADYINNLLTKGEISNYFNFIPQSNFTQLQQLNWVKTIGEILKEEDLIEDKNYYLPYSFVTNQNNNMLGVYNTLNNLTHQLILEITLQPYHPTQNTNWIGAINQTINQLNQVKNQSNSHSDPYLDYTLSLYQDYQKRYINNSLYFYNIKALAENESECFLILNTLKQQATLTKPNTKPCKIITRNQGETGFNESLQATQLVKYTNAIQWQKWQENFGKIAIKQAIKTTKTGMGKYAEPDNSLNIENIMSQTQTYQPSLPQSQLQESSLVVSHGGALSLNFLTKPTEYKIEDLKPLHRLATFEEISGFFRMATPDLSNQFPDILTIEDVIKNHSDLITEDTFFVGINQEGNPIIADFSQIPHRIVAGETGYGKTNYITSIMYQFLYANKERNIYIIDFQAGLHYQFIVENNPTVKMVTELENCAKILKNLWNIHDSRRKEMVEYKVRNLKKLEEVTGIKQSRILVIIDEAAYIKTAEISARREIEKYVSNLAAQSRVTGIHFVYCSQTPTAEIIDSQTSNNMSERMCFRLVSTVDSRRLVGEDTPCNLPVKPAGRGVYKGSNGLPEIVATPYVSDEIWEHPVINKK